jgi:hypothetical protein
MTVVVAVGAALAGAGAAAACVLACSRLAGMLRALLAFSSRSGWNPRNTS